MTVLDLINELKNYPPSYRVVIGQEGSPLCAVLDSNLEISNIKEGVGKMILLSNIEGKS
jgi:hypothetical protein